MSPLPKKNWLKKLSMNKHTLFRMDRTGRTPNSWNITEDKEVSQLETGRGQYQYTMADVFAKRL
jgi:hypothetical protein